MIFIKRQSEMAFALNLSSIRQSWRSVMTLFFRPKIHSLLPGLGIRNLNCSFQKLKGKTQIILDSTYKYSQSISHLSQSVLLVSKTTFQLQQKQFLETVCSPVSHRLSPSELQTAAAFAGLQSAMVTLRNFTAYLNSEHLWVET